MNEFRAEQRLKSLARAFDYWSITPDCGDAEGERGMRLLLTAMGDEANFGEVGAAAAESCFALLAQRVKEGGGAKGPLGKKIYGLIAYMGEPSEGIINLQYGGLPDVDMAIPFDYYFFLDLCEQLNGLGEPKAYSDFGKSLKEMGEEVAEGPAARMMIF